jgi:hypothetical protein
MRQVITMAHARSEYRAQNNAGNGFAPGGASDSIDDAVAYYVACGATLVLDRRTSDDVAVVCEHPGSSGATLIAIGGDAMGRSAWAVAIDAGHDGLSELGPAARWRR